jgi:hypothetical protein
MRRCGRIDVSERQHLIILEDYVSGDVTLNDFSNKVMLIGNLMHAPLMSNRNWHYGQNIP